MLTLSRFEDDAGLTVKVDVIRGGGANEGAKVDDVDFGGIVGLVGSGRGRFRRSQSSERK